jgi:hypothetical protein
MKKVAFLTLIALGSAASLVIAAPEHGHGHRGAGIERLKAADTNGDGMISRAEAAGLPRLAERFDQVDANRDGQLTRDEMRAFHQARKAQARGDANADGKVTREEFLARAAQRFERLDANHDGVLDAGEARAKRGHRGHRHG